MRFVLGADHVLAGERIEGIRIGFVVLFALVQRQVFGRRLQKVHVLQPHQHGAVFEQHPPLVVLTHDLLLIHHREDHQLVECALHPFIDGPAIDDWNDADPARCGRFDRRRGHPGRFD